MATKVPPTRHGGYGLYPLAGCMVLGISWKDKVSNDFLYGTLPKLSDKIRSRRLKMAGHCIRHPKLLTNDLVTWEPEARRMETKRVNLGRATCESH